MNIREEFLNKHSKKQAEKVVKYVGTDKARFRELMSCFLSREAVLAQRAAMAVGYCAKSQPQLFSGYLQKILVAMHQPVHDAIVRNGLQIFRLVKIPTSLESRVVEMCFQLMTSVNSPIAIKVYAIGVIQKIAEKYPELVQELQMRVKAQLPFESNTFAAHVRRKVL